MTPDKRELVSESSSRQDPAQCLMPVAGAVAVVYLGTAPEAM